VNNKQKSEKMTLEFQPVSFHFQGEGGSFQYCTPGSPMDSVRRLLTPCRLSPKSPKSSPGSPKQALRKAWWLFLLLKLLKLILLEPTLAEYHGNQREYFMLKRAMSFTLETLLY
jgi:hypothetical protein